MAQSNLDYGTVANDGTGEGLRDSMVKIQSNFDELYSGTLQTVSVPASATATGTANQIAIDSGYIYICVAEDTWVRTALTTW